MDVKRTLIVSLVLLAASLFVGELAAFAGFKFYATERLARHWRVDPSTAVASLTPASIQRYQYQFFDPVLGWSFREETTAFPYAAFDATGARVDSVEGPTGRIAAYGDSFTFGEGAGNDETWPHFLAEALEVPVANYGVAGYGPDQALLRLKGHLANGGVPQIAIIGVLSENIARVVNVWRSAYAGSETLNFKPILLVDDGAPPQWLPNPLEAPIGVGAVRQAIEKSQSHDFWLEHNRHRPPKPRFPYLLSAIESFAYFGFESVRWQDLWQKERPQRVLAAIIDEFVLVSEEYSFLPILVMIPMGDDLRLRERGEPPTYERMLGELRDQYQGRLTVVDILDESFEASRFHLRPFQGHSSQYGNRAIASAILANLPAAP
jgi:hypothetical protein